MKLGFNSKTYIFCNSSCELMEKKLKTRRKKSITFARIFNYQFIEQNLIEFSTRNLGFSFVFECTKYFLDMIKYLNYSSRFEANFSYISGLRPRLEVVGN